MLVKVIPQGHCLIVERFGRPIRTVMSGLHFFMPFFDNAKNVGAIWGGETNKNGIFIELTEQITDTTPRSYFTKDNVSVTTNCIFNWRIVDPIKAVYEVDHLHQTLKEAVLNQIRSYIGGHELNYILSSRAEISEQIVAGLAASTRNWGVNLIKAEIQDLKTDDATLDAMRLEMEATRRGKAAKLESEGKAEALLKLAEAEKNAAILKAEGEKEALSIIAQGEKEYIAVLTQSVGVDEATKILIAQKTLQTYAAIANSPANKIFLPPPAAASILMLDNEKK